MQIPPERVSAAEFDAIDRCFPFDRSRGAHNLAEPDVIEAGRGVETGTDLVAALDAETCALEAADRSPASASTAGTRQSLTIVSRGSGSSRASDSASDPESRLRQSRHRIRGAGAFGGRARDKWRNGSRCPETRPGRGRTTNASRSACQVVVDALTRIARQLPVVGAARGLDHPPDRMHLDARCPIETRWQVAVRESGTVLPTGEVGDHRGRALRQFISVGRQRIGSDGHQVHGRRAGSQ